MAKSTQQPELPKPRLSSDLELCKAKIEARVELGKDIVGMPIANEGQLAEAKAKRDKWHDFNRDLLETLFTNAKVAREYEHNSYARVGFVSMGPTPLYEKVENFKESLIRKINALENIAERLELYDQIIPESSLEQKQNESGVSNSNNSVFVVHGHDDLIKTELTAYLKDLGIKPIVLNDQPNKGKTIIEKLEFYAVQASYAIVLLTPDDEGKSKTEKQPQARARQNVILELGYFIGKLGRDKTCALYKKEVALPDLELPSDYSGVVYTPLDNSGGWKLSLAKELKASGLNVDMNKLV